MQPVVLGLQNGSRLLADGDTRGAFEQPPFREAFDFYLGLFRDHLAPTAGLNDIANMYQEFERGTFAMVVTGPWNLGEFARRLPPELQHAWDTAPLPGPEGPGLSMAGGSSLVVLKSSRRKPDAWRLLEFLSRPEQQARFYRLTGDLPARREAWRDSALAADPRARAFEQQLLRVAPWPKVPEWEQITTMVLDRTESAVRGSTPPDSALAALDRDVDRVLEKRRWLLERARHGARAAAGGAP